MRFNKPNTYTHTTTKRIQASCQLQRGWHVHVRAGIRTHWQPDFSCEFVFLGPFFDSHVFLQARLSHPCCFNLFHFLGLYRRLPSWLYRIEMSSHAVPYSCWLPNSGGRSVSDALWFSPRIHLRFCRTSRTRNRTNPNILERTHTLVIYDYVVEGSRRCLEGYQFHLVHALNIPGCQCFIIIEPRVRKWSLDQSR